MKAGEAFDWMRENPGKELVDGDGIRWKFCNEVFKVLSWLGKWDSPTSAVIEYTLKQGYIFTIPTEPEVKLPQSVEKAITKQAISYEDERALRETFTALLQHIDATYERKK